MSYEEDCFHLGAKALIHNINGQLLLLQKNSKKTLWDLPGGRIHRNESLEEALKREVYEETGLSISPAERFMMVLSHTRIPLQESDVGLILAIYLCAIPQAYPTIQLSDEHRDFAWATPSQAAEQLAANHPAELIQKIAQLNVEQPYTDLFADQINT